MYFRAEARELQDRGVGDGWTLARDMCGRKLFYLNAIVLFLVIIDVGLLALLAEQTINIVKNQVITAVSFLKTLLTLF